MLLDTEVLRLFNDMLYVVCHESFTSGVGAVQVQEFVCAAIDKGETLEEVVLLPKLLVHKQVPDHIKLVSMLWKNLVQCYSSTVLI